jgi:tRNA (adenine57-N1/adenine58-N1)-methyltransferase catalytic subunit
MAYESFNSIKPLLLEPPKILNNRFGQFAHEKIISTPISSKVYDMKNENYIRCLSPTPELWTKALQMRTQILYRPDISMITGRLDVKPGSVIVEAGTGSGSLSMSFVRALLPTGKLFTYEFNEARANQAQKEFQMLGLGQFVVSEHRDVVQSGLGHKEMEKANGVFLDLPNPWAVIKSAYEVLDDSGVICTFSPCIEQVQKNCEEMERVGFHNIVSLETLSRPFNVKMNGEKLIVHHNNQDERLHTGYLSFGYK